MNKCDNTLKIYPVKSQPDSSRFEGLHNHLLKPPFTLILNNSTGQGKTTTVANLVLREEMYDIPNEKYFDLFIIISPTIYNCKTSVPMIEYADAIYDKYDDSIIDNIIDLQKDDEDDQHILILIDDCLGVQMNKVRYLVSRNRHLRCSLIISLQAFKSKSSHPIIRANASGYFIGEAKNTKEYEKISDEFSGLFGGKQNFKKLYSEATKEKYSFLYLDLKNIRAFKNLTNLLWEKKNN